MQCKGLLLGHDASPSIVVLTSSSSRFRSRSRPRPSTPSPCLPTFFDRTARLLRSRSSARANARMPCAFVSKGGLLSAFCCVTNVLHSILTNPSIAMVDWFAVTFLRPGLRPAVSSPLLSMRTDVMLMMLITRCTTSVLVVMTF
jgi:hypothetical protein